MRVLVAWAYRECLSKESGCSGEVAIFLHRIHGGVLCIPEFFDSGFVQLGRLGERPAGVQQRRGKWLGYRLALREVPDLIGGQVGPYLRRTAQPMDFKAIDPGCGAKADVNTVTILREIRCAADSPAHRYTLYPGNDRSAVAKAKRSTCWRNPVVQTELNPMSLRNIVSQEPDAFTLIYDGDIHSAIVVVVGHGQPAAYVRL